MTDRMRLPSRRPDFSAMSYEELLRYAVTPPPGAQARDVESAAVTIATTHRDRVTDDEWRQLAALAVGRLALAIDLLVYGRLPADVAEALLIAPAALSATPGDPRYQDAWANDTYFRLHNVTQRLSPAERACLFGQSRVLAPALAMFAAHVLVGTPCLADALMVDQDERFRRTAWDILCVRAPRYALHLLESQPDDVRGYLSPAQAADLIAPPPEAVDFIHRGDTQDLMELVSHVGVVDGESAPLVPIDDNAVRQQVRHQLNGAMGPTLFPDPSEEAAEREAWDLVRSLYHGESFEEAQRVVFAIARQDRSRVPKSSHPLARAMEPTLAQLAYVRLRTEWATAMMTVWREREPRLEGALVEIRERQEDLLRPRRQCRARDAGDARTR